MAAIAVVAGFVVSATAVAQSHGGGHVGGFVGGRAGYGGWHGGHYGGWRGGYGWRGYGGWYGGWGWGGLGYGLFLGALPWYYSTYWWNGVPYYYADNTYYLWNRDVGQYETVESAAGARQSSGLERSTGEFQAICVPQEWADTRAAIEGQDRVSEVGRSSNRIRPDSGGQRSRIDPGCHHRHACRDSVAGHAAGLSTGAIGMFRRSRLQRAIAQRSADFHIGAAWRVRLPGPHPRVTHGESARPPFG